MASWQDMTEAERIQHSLKFGTDYAKQFNQAQIDNILAGNVSNGGMLTTGQPAFAPNMSVPAQTAQPSQTFAQALEQQWANNPALLEQAIQQNPEAFQSGLLTGETTSENSINLVDEIANLNNTFEEQTSPDRLEQNLLDFHGEPFDLTSWLAEDPSRTAQQAYEEGLINVGNANSSSGFGIGLGEYGAIESQFRQEYANNLDALLAEAGKQRIEERDGQLFALYTGQDDQFKNVSALPVGYQWAEEPKTPGEYYAIKTPDGGVWDNYINPFVRNAIRIGGALTGNPIVAATTAGANTAALGGDLAEIAKDATTAGVSSVVNNSIFPPGAAGGSTTVGGETFTDIGTVGSTANTIGNIGVGSIGLTGSGVTPYETGVMPGSPPDDFKDVDMSDPAAVLDATRVIIDAGFPIPSWGMKWEDVKEWPATAWEEVQGWIDGSSNPIETVQKVFDVGVDKATDIVDKVIGGGVAIYDVLKDTFESDGSGGTGTMPPVGGTPEEEDEVAELPGDTTVEEDGLSLGQPPEFEPVEEEEDEVIENDEIVEDPQTGQIVITEGPVSEPSINPPEIAQPDELTTGGTVAGENPVTDGEDSPVSGGGGGGGGGFGEFEPFQAGISYNVPMLTRVNTELRNFLAELYNRG